MKNTTGNGSTCNDLRGVSDFQRKCPLSYQVLVTLETNVPHRKITATLDISTEAPNDCFLFGEANTASNFLLLEATNFYRVHTKNCNHFSRTFQGPH